MPKVDLAHVVVIGAGPAGLVAAWELVRSGVAVTVLERAPAAGGMCATSVFEGRAGTYRFDYGGHRFITHDHDLLALVEDLLGPDLLTAQRKSVIRLGGRTYRYPLEAGDLLRNAPWSLLAGAMRDVALLRRRQDIPRDFAGWTISRFGPTLYKAFFEGYTAKLWGIDPRGLSGDWADQRISLLDLRQVARLLIPGAGSGPRTYARGYRYPKRGFGQLFQALADRVVQLGARLRPDTPVEALDIRDGRVRAVRAGGDWLACDAVVSTMALPDMVRLTGGDSALRFRGLRFLNMAFDLADVSDCTWQYLSDADIMATRLQEPKRRSPFMAPPGRTSVMLEIPCDPGTDLWQAADADLVPRALADLKRLGVDVSKATGEVWGARAAQAYPMMDLAYGDQRQQAIDHLRSVANLVQCGRQGAFRYVFTDTAMEMGRMAAQGLLAGQDNRDRIYQHRNERTVIETQSVA